MNFPRIKSFTSFGLLVFALLVQPAAARAEPIDRQALVTRHDVIVKRIDPESALSVGNGDFAFTVDVTGLQSFETLYHTTGIPLETLSTWAWHSFPNPGKLRLEDAMAPYPFHGRTVLYASLQNSPAGEYFRANPHPIPLGQISLMLRGQPVSPDALSAIDQRLELWSGRIVSRYTLADETVEVETVAHSESSTVGIKLRSRLIERGELNVRFAFPYSYQLSSRNKPPFVWDKPELHRTAIIKSTPRSAQVERILDDSHYAVTVQWEGDAALHEHAPHDLRLTAKGSDTLAFTCQFSPDASPDSPQAQSFADVQAASAHGWKGYWTHGGAIDLSGSTDPRAAELERRIVLSQYLVKVNYAGNMPPGETGLTHLSWYGKHNSEVFFWHAAHFAQWGRPELLEKGLGWYQRILPSAKADAAAQGFEGARWPKMAGIDGRTGPGTINPFIIWNQPNPIYLSELVYRAHPDRATLDKYRDVVFESARFLASFAYFDKARDRYVIGPPIRNVSESSGENSTQNPTFELAYWYFGLQVAQTWRERLGLPPEPLWADILAKLSRLPVHNGKYLEIETFPDMYDKSGGLPTSMLMSFGFLPRTPLLDVDTARRTFHEVNRRNGVERWVSWSLGQGAMTAARLGESATATDILTNNTPAARFMPSGHVRRPKEPNGCVTYLPVNGSLLCAVALMAAGWDEAPRVNAPGFPQDGTWNVKWEGLNPLP